MPATRSLIPRSLSGNSSFPVRQSLFENRLPANGNLDGLGWALQQRYDQSKRPASSRPRPTRRKKLPTFPPDRVVSLPPFGSE